MKANSKYTQNHKKKIIVEGMRSFKMVQALTDSMDHSILDLGIYPLHWVLQDV